MKASETNFLKFLQGTKQFVTPIYQRRYTWTKKACQRLLEDIERAASDKIAGHFIGAIVYIENSLYHVSSVTQLSVIDGQQRIATLMLILFAIGKRMEETGAEQDISLRKIMNYYLVNAEEEDEQFFRFLLTKSDRLTLNSMLLGDSLPKKYSKRLVDNYEFIEQYLIQSDLTPYEFYRGVAKLFMVDISLNIEHDDPQLIFESLNSTGIDLAQVDLIRNLLLMKLNESMRNRLYQNYWFPIEDFFAEYMETNLFDRFMRDYLTMKSGKTPSINGIYANFKEYLSEEYSIDEVMQDIHRYADYYLNFVYLKEEDDDLRSCFADLNSLNVDVAYPMLLVLYDDYKTRLLSKGDFIEILRIIEAYIFRRSVCEVPTNTLGKTFLMLQRTLEKHSQLNIIIAVLLTRDSYRRFPDDIEFKQALMNKDIYNFRNRNYLLRKLENFKSKEVVDVENLTVEHIMPQNKNLSQSWKRMLGPNWEVVHQQWLHCLGNLTLTAYNAELGDRSFEDKKTMKGGYADSPLRINHSLVNVKQWNADEIEKRAEKLAEHALSIWEYPAIPDEILARYFGEDEQLPVNPDLEEQYPFLNGKLLLVFEQLRERIMNLDSGVREEMKKQYIAYKLDTNFVDVEPQKKCLRLSINMGFSDVNDPHGICKDISNTSRWGNGEVEVKIQNVAEIEAAMDVIRQAINH